jgi:hypothetical protein
MVQGLRNGAEVVEREIERPGRTNVREVALYRARETHVSSVMLFRALSTDLSLLS